MKKYYLFEMDMKSVNILCVIISIALLISLPVDCLENVDLVLLLVLSLPYFILHEIIHSIAYVLCGAKFKNITYGAHLEKGILCCSCKQNITKTNVVISLLAPFIFIGVITYVIGFLFSNHLLIMLSVLNMAGCAGDLIMFYSLCRLKNFEFSEYDNPIAFGLYTNENLSKRKLFGLKYIDSANTLKITKTKKITISKKSILLFIIIWILLIIKIIREMV